MPSEASERPASRGRFLGGLDHLVVQPEVFQDEAADGFEVGQ